MLIFCCIWSPSLCTLALHIAGSLWRLDFNHSSLFRHPLALHLHSGPFPRSFIRYTCIIAYGRFICLPLISHSRATVTADSDNIFPARYFSRYYASRVFSDSHVLLASRACVSPPSYVVLRYIKSAFFSLVKAVNFAAPRGQRNDQSAVPEDPKEIWESREIK